MKNAACKLALAVSASALLTGTADAGTLLASNDGIIKPSLCVGGDCVTNENFGAVTVRLKENNLRVQFDDTSTGSFPANDWQIIANSSANGGNSFLSFYDDTANRYLFVVEAAAPANSLYVDDGGRVGLGTAAPVTDLHIKDGDSPTLRLEQDGSSGFGAQTWDVVGNETNFFVRDATNGSQLPFRIRPGADSNSIFIDTDNDVGMGTASPGAPLHVKRATGAATDLLRLENNEGVVLRMVDTAADGQEWTFQSNNGVFRVASPAVPGPELTLDDNGNLTITGEITTSGSCSVGCDRVFDADYDLKPLAQHNAMMWEQGYLPNVGPTAEDGPMNLSDKVGGMLNELEHAHIYIGQLHQQNAVLETRLIDQEAQIKALSARLDTLTNN